MTSFGPSLRAKYLLDKMCDFRTLNYRSIIRNKISLGMVVLTCNPGYLVAEAGGSQVESQVEVSAT